MVGFFIFTAERDDFPIQESEGKVVFDGFQVRESKGMCILFKFNLIYLFYTAGSY